MAAIWHELVDDARRAPSPHNTQAWTLDIVDDAHATLSYQPDRLLPVEDPGGAFLTCSMGIFAEALRAAAAARGFALADEFCGPCGPASAAAKPVAQLSLAIGPERHDERALLLSRRTSRLPYDGRPVPEGALHCAVTVFFGPRTASAVFESAHAIAPSVDETTIV